ncbi:ATP-binding protein [Flavobacterium sp. GT3R68]|uniref:tetratricopeptide repeat-containing sensor histidine kinase n=1 Tax=Flavobacterium sp. GT3R68 TaxID=2594437 RepID=UPI000F875AAD|nr:ATP-binding protein [Flavobacterium sp. GT3R68]RTY95830.1 hypothetical protein EKL32_04080 [Flavobacterium sp. GSN2]TRW93602.1 hypothetical protein FNW07_01470 [Flavobacterium sp. GT3R68]
MNKAILLLWFSVFFISCTEKEKNKSPERFNDNVDTLLVKANDFKRDSRIRLAYSDKVYELIQDQPNDSVTRNNYFKLAGRYYNLKKYEKYIKICRRVHTMALESNNTLDVAKALHYIGDYHYAKFQNDSSYYYFSKAEKTYLFLKRQKDVNSLRLYKANILFFEKDFSGCEAAIISILKTVQEKGDERLRYDCYIGLGNALEGMNNSENALLYYNKAFEATKDLTSDPQYLLLKAQSFNFIGRVYQKANNHVQAIDYFKNALLFDDFRKNEPLMYANLINNLAYSRFKSKDNSALLELKEALTIRDSLDNIPGIVSSRINLSEFYLAQKDTVKAFLNSNEARTKAHDNKIFEDELRALGLLAEIDIRKSSFYNEKFIKLTDSLQNNERATRNKFARIEFETDEILDQKNNIEAEKNELATQRWIIGGGSVIIFALGILLFIVRMQRAKNRELQFEQEQQKANEEIYQLMLSQQSKIEEGRQNEKKRISQELHDGIMSKLTSTRLNLFVLSKKTDEETIKKCLIHIEGIQNIEKEIRSISHDLNQDLFSAKDSFKTIIEALFEEQENISNVACQLDIDETIAWENVESTTKMHLYRIFQEALQNIHKYAKATKISAAITKAEDTIHVEIKDNGAGFNTKKTREGIGLKNMQSRIKIVNGEITIRSQKGKGTSIYLVIPL